MIKFFKNLLPLYYVDISNKNDYLNSMERYNFYETLKAINNIVQTMYSYLDKVLSPEVLKVIRRQKEYVGKNN